MARTTVLLGLCASGLLYTGFSVTSLAGWMAILCSSLYMNSAIFTQDKAPKLYYVDTPLSKYIIQHCKRLREPFRPPYWARNSHVQTVLPVILPKIKYTFTREFLDLSDGGVLSLDFGDVDKDSLHPDSPVLIAIPGLNGDSGYVIYLCKEAARRGFRPIVFNKRGLAGSHITTPKLQSFGDPTDLREVIQILRKRYPKSEFVAVGVSAGSGLLVSYLGEFGATCDITAAVCNCPGYKIKPLFHRLKQPYDYIMLRGLKQMLRRHQAMLSKAIDVDAVLQTKRCIDFEEQVYKNIYKYETMEEYYKHNEPGRSLETTVPPVLCINSSDDPICLEEIFPYEVFREMSNGLLAVTAEGGHCGFVQRSTWNRWADDVALDFIETVQAYNKEQTGLD